MFGKTPKRFKRKVINIFKQFELNVQIEGKIILDESILNNNQHNVSLIEEVKEQSENSDTTDTEDEFTIDNMTQTVEQFLSIAVIGTTLTSIKY